MTKETPTLYTPDNTVFTLHERAFSRNPSRQHERQRFYAAIRKNPLVAMGSLVIITDEQKRTANVDSFETEEYGYQHKGVGQLLMKACVAHLKHEGYTHLDSDSVSSSALCARSSVFRGQMEVMSFYDPDHLDVGALPLNVSQVIDQTVRMENLRQSTRGLGVDSYLPSYFGTLVDLQSVDTTGWPHDIVDYGRDSIDR